MSPYYGLFVPFWGGERPRGGEAGLPGRVAWDPTNVTRWKHKVAFHNRGIQRDTPMARWASEGYDWVKLMAQRKAPQGRCNSQFTRVHETNCGEEDQVHGTRPAKKPRELPPLELEIPEEGKN